MGEGFPAMGSGGALVPEAAVAIASTVACHMCGKDCVADKAKLLSKKDGPRWECAACQRVDLVVARKVGSIQWLRDLDPAVSTQFYREAHSCNPAAVSKLCE